MLIPKEDIEQAYNRIKNFLVPTPLVHSRYYSTRFNTNIYLKMEIMHPTHSFKVRGAFNSILSLTKEECMNGVVTASGGNHGLGVSLVASTLGLKATIFLPVSTPKIKIDAIKQLGSEVILKGDAWDEANYYAIEKSKIDGMAYIHPFNNHNVMAGQGTIVCEILEQLPKVDLIVVSIGGGGLISGIISAKSYFSKSTRVIGVETKGADCLYKSVKEGKIIALETIESVAESLGTKKTELPQFNIISKHVDDLVVIDDEDAIKALLETLQEEKILVEPATSCSLAAINLNKIKVEKNWNVVVVMCGANVSLERVLEWHTKFKTYTLN